MARESVPRGLALFGKRLLKTRKAVGLTQSDTSERIGYSRHVVSHAESGHQAPSREVAVALDELFGTVDQFADLWDDMARDRRPGWIVAMMSAEAQATGIRWIELVGIPGLLQTENYARAVFRSGRLISAEEVEEHVTTRMQRQEILHGKNPPRLWVIIDEAALCRMIGGREVMRDQMAYLLKLMHLEHVDIQILPFSIGAHPATAGPFILYDVDGRGTAAYLDSPAGGTTTSDAGTVGECEDRFNVLRALALSMQDSADVITQRMRELEQ